MSHLTGSTKGLGIVVTGTDSSGAVVIDEQAVGKDPDDNDLQAREIAYRIYATNTSGSDVKLTLEWGGTAAGNLIEKTITAESGLDSIINALSLTTPIAIKAFADTANAIVIYGERKD